MKKKMQVALGALLALTCTVTAAAQSKEQLTDTIVISPNKEFKIMLIGEGTKNVATNNKFDSLKLLFLADLEEAFAKNAYPMETKQTYYFVAKNGKRRLKIESEDYQQTAIDIEKEKEELELNLPPYHYTIFDMANNYQYQVYLSDPKKLALLKDINCSAIIQEAAIGKKVFRKEYRIDIEQEKGKWVNTTVTKNRWDFLEVTTNAGATMVGSSLSPLLGASCYFMTSDKFRVPKLRAGLAINTYTFSEYSNFDFKNIYIVSDYELRFMLNIGQKSIPKKPIWLGVDVGTFVGYKKGNLDKSIKFGLIVENKGVEYSINRIWLRDADKNSLYAFSVRFTL